MTEQDLSTAKTFKRLAGFIAPYKIGLIVAAIALVINAGADAVMIAMLKPLLDDGFAKADTEFLKFMAFFVVGVIGIRGLANFVSRYCLAWVSGKVVMIFRRKLFTHMMHMPVAFFDKNNTGKLLSRITYDSEQVASSASNSLVSIVREGSYTIALIGVMFYNSWKLSLILFIIAPIMAVIVKIVSKRFRILSKKMQSSMGDVASSTEQMLRGHKVVLSYGGHSIEEERFNDVSNDMRLRGMKLVTAEAISSPVIQLIASFALGVVLYLASMPNIIGEELTAGTFTVIFSSMLSMMRPLRALTAVNAQFQRGMAACQTLFGILDLPTEEDNGTYTTPRAIGNIKFNQVTFTYPETENTALKDMSLNIQAGKTIALVGRSGSGKSTIANLLMRFYSINDGEIMLDNVNINNYKLHNLREQFASVSQHVHLFNDTVANNIAYAAGDKFSRKEIEDAAKAAHVLDFTQNLEHGLDTIIGEDGFNLSGGQRQRIAIARALLRNSPILILDEATSALDTESERIIQDALALLKKDRTVIIIAHRLSTIEAADQILVIEDGQVFEQGTHNELLQKQGMYYQLHNMQFNS